MTSIFSAGRPTGLWIGRLSLLLLVFSGCLADNNTASSTVESTSALPLPYGLGNQSQCNKAGSDPQECDMTTGHWCQANIGLLMANIDESTIFSMDGCSKPTSIPNPAPVNNSLLCFKNAVLFGYQYYMCFCNLLDDCTDLFNMEMIAEARRMYYAEFDPTTTTRKPTTTTTTEKPVVTSAAANSSTTDGNKWSSTMTTSRNNSLFLSGMAALFVILICVLLVVGAKLAWKWKKARDTNKLYGRFGIVNIDFFFLLCIWNAWDKKLAGAETYGMMRVANSNDLAKGKEYVDGWIAKYNTRKAIVRGTALECKDDKGKKVHGNYLNKEKTIIAALEPNVQTADGDPPYYGSFVKMIVAKQPAVIVNLGFFNHETVDILGEFPNCKHQFVGERFYTIGRFQRKLTLKKLGTFISRRSLQFVDEKDTKKETFHACEHITYNAWPEGGSATETDCLTLLAAYVFEKYVSQNKLVVITSEHGCGRTGTFALALLLLKEAASRELTSKDVLRIAVEIRRSRYTAIYGPMQFGFGITLAFSVHAKHLRDKELRKKSSQLFIKCKIDMTKELPKNNDPYATGKFKFDDAKVDEETYEILNMEKEKEIGPIFSEMNDLPAHFDPNFVHPP